VDKITVRIGTLAVSNGGREQDLTRVVEFIGEQLAIRTEAGVGRGSEITDTRGVTETLYRAEDGRLVVYVEDWSHWQNEPNTYTLHVVTEADLQPGGRFERLGYESDYGRALTLDEALQELADVGDGALV